MQALYREANRLESKAAFLEVTKASFELKLLVELMVELLVELLREEVQNVESDAQGGTPAEAALLDPQVCSALHA
jgi:hypothetical protein